MTDEQVEQMEAGGLDVSRDGLHTPTIQALVDGLPVTLHRTGGDLVVLDVVEDSRKVGPGSLFVARAGETCDGRDWIGAAEAAGACCVLSDAAGCRRADGPAIECDDPSAIGAQLAELVHGHPSKALAVIGITGTNGKSTTATILQHLLSTPSHPCGLIGGIEVDDGRVRRPATLTTPRPIELAGFLGSMVHNGCASVVMEVSSHALELGRVEHVHFDAAIFTNLSGDHLDFHGDMASYARAKKRLFQQLPEHAHAIINIDDQHGADMAGASCCTIIECGDGAAARVLCMKEDLGGSRGRFEGPWGSFEAEISLPGRHNLTNALQAVATAFQLGISIDDIASRLSTCPCPRGRLERVMGYPGAPAVFIDFAHTDDALRSTLSSIQPLLAPGVPLLVVFGCGGDRDCTKRPRMAAAALSEADHVFVTSDNPRSEDPAGIIEDIIADLTREELACVTIEVDRSRAISAAIDQAVLSNAVVLIAGKGHEQVQLIEGRQLPFDDLQVATRCLAQHGPTISWSARSCLEKALPGSRWIVAPPQGWEGCSGLSIDSRELTHGDMFIAIRGEVHDGHDHAQGAVDEGATMLMVERDLGIRTVPCLLVKDARMALSSLASSHRASLGTTPIIGVTGSCGKTTVKELLREVLSELGPVCASRRSFNNDIGLPLTLLEGSARHHAVILEMGSNAPGEIEFLARIARPDFAIVTMIGSSHLEGLDSLEGVAREKYSLLPHVRDTAWIRNDDFPLPAATDAKIHRFGTTGLRDIRQEDGRTTFTVADGAAFTMQLHGNHNALNALAVIELARSMGLDDEAIQRGLDRVQPVQGRGGIECIDGIDFIDESYNANPDSMWAAIDTILQSAPDSRRIVLVLGDMLELGDRADELHATLGGRIAAHPGAGKVDLILLVGQHVQGVARGLATSRWPGDRLLHEPNVDDAAMERIAALVLPGDLVLVKASRGLALERILECRRATETEAIGS